MVVFWHDKLTSIYVIVPLKMLATNTKVVNAFVASAYARTMI